MKHNVLRSVAHNIADSFSSGMCFLVGLYEIDVFKEAEENENQVIIVDFLNGHATD
jgi:hypothetical protein